MAFPPAIPPNNRTNATDMVDAHASDHNAVSNALTDIVAYTNPTAWVAFPFAAGFSNYGAPYQVCQYRRRGDVVEMRGTWRMNTPAAPANQLVGTLPVGFRPPASVQIAGPQAGTSVLCQVEIDSAGTCKLVGGSGSVIGMTQMGYAFTTST